MWASWHESTGNCSRQHQGFGSVLRFKKRLMVRSCENTNCVPYWLCKVGSQTCIVAHPGLHACMCAGLSRPLQESEQHVPAGNHVGTIMYTAPEIFRDSRLTKPGDVYAFGIMSKNTVCQLDMNRVTCLLVIRKQPVHCPRLAAHQGNLFLHVICKSGFFRVHTHARPMLHAIWLHLATTAEGQSSATSACYENLLDNKLSSCLTWHPYYRGHVCWVRQA